jgi:hypothetical protein
MNESPHSQQIDLRTLIGHTIALQAEGKLEDIYQLFGKHNIAFIAVLENEQVIGMCSRWQIGMLLGSRYGFSLFSRKPVRDHLLPDALRVSAQSPIASVLEKVASRSEETFYDDLVLVDEAVFPWNGRSSQTGGKMRCSYAIFPSRDAWWTSRYQIKPFVVWESFCSLADCGPPIFEAE